MHKKSRRGAAKPGEESTVAQTIEGFVGKSLDEAKISPLHVKIIGLIAAGYFFDVIDFTILGSLAPSVTLLILCRFIAGLGLGAEQPLAFAYAGEYAPKAIRGRILAIVHFIGGACVWPIGTALVLLLGTTIFPTSPETVWRCAWIIIGVGSLVVWVFRFSLPESPRYLATHGRGQEALDVLKRLDIPSVPALSALSTDAASNTRSDPFAVVFRMFPRRVIAGMICFTAFFGVAIGLG